MIDIEGDGDLDFIEATRTAFFRQEGEGRHIVIHRNEGGVQFADGVAVELPVGYDSRGSVDEHPFVAAGGAEGAFLVGYEDFGINPRVLWPIECVP